MSNDATPVIGQIRIKNGNYCKITSIGKSIVWAIDCNELGEPIPNTHTFGGWIESCGSDLGEPIETHNARLKAKQSISNFYKSKTK